MAFKKKRYTFLMSEDSGKEAPRQIPHSHNEIVANDKVAIMQQVAPEFGVSIRVLAGEGEEYTHYVGGRKSYGGPVPKEKSYVEIANPKGDLSSFYSAVEAKQKANQPPTNPPKT